MLVNNLSPIFCKKKLDKFILILKKKVSSFNTAPLHAPEPQKTFLNFVIIHLLLAFMFQISFEMHEEDQLTLIFKNFK